MKDHIKEFPININNILSCRKYSQGSKEASFDIKDRVQQEKEKFIPSQVYSFKDDSSILDNFSDIMSPDIRNNHINDYYEEVKIDNYKD